MFEKPPPPPPTCDALTRRALALAGRPLKHTAGRFGLPVPADLRRAKGWIGQLLETALGATASSRPIPDFPHLGIELKTLPVLADGRPRESTYVCTAPLDGTMAATWEESWVAKKLACVLWVPIIGDASTAPGDRIIGRPWMWTPTEEEEALLRADWEELAGMIHLGEFWQLDARHGVVLQIRPKAANNRDRTWTVDEDGVPVREIPRGFYLRPSFTRGLLQHALRVG